MKPLRSRLAGISAIPLTKEQMKKIRGANDYPTGCGDDSFGVITCQDVGSGEYSYISGADTDCDDNAQYACQEVLGAGFVFVQCNCFGN